MAPQAAAFRIATSLRLCGSGVAAESCHTTTILPSRERFGEIPPEILRVLDPDAQAKEGRREVFLPRHRCPTFHRRLHASETRRVTNELHAGAHSIGRRGIARHRRR